ncbi:peptidoglycan recognition protein [Culex quinquefasciatus]|uniref:Peptidoglycan-recognition protein n=1 Tax=Culex quinquefasciatus TaxID=7176 RepID=B0WJ33_CULQU|nr:peptidoglycan recognition protein [Culex quinquefasciatus]|eukprot:XP_001848717.1 peptidoglycan recognition protein [Culex quinquefasciatus]
MFYLKFRIFKVSAADPADCPKIIKREQWGALKSTNVTYQVMPVQYVVIHHTATVTCDEMPICKNIVRSIQDAHQSMNKWSDIGYNFLIANGGNVYEGIGWHRVGAHTRGYNSKSIGIAFIGDFSEELPTVKALRAAGKLLRCGVALGELDPEYMLYGARQLSATASPGDALYADIQDWDHFDASKRL